MTRWWGDRLLAGVAAGLAARTGRDVMIIRLLFVLAALLSVGVPAYVIAWLLVPMVGEDTNIPTKALTDRRGLALGGRSLIPPGRRADHCLCAGRLIAG